jgi:hypothetical protein
MRRRERRWRQYRPPFLLALGSQLGAAGTIAIVLVVLVVLEVRPNLVRGQASQFGALRWWWNATTR